MFGPELIPINYELIHELIKTAGPRETRFQKTARRLVHLKT